MSDPLVHVPPSSVDSEISVDHLPMALDTAISPGTCVGPSLWVRQPDTSPSTTGTRIGAGQ